jgi:hypothetical protein
VCWIFLHSHELVFSTQFSLSIPSFLSFFSVDVSFYSLMEAYEAWYNAIIYCFIYYLVTNSIGQPDSADCSLRQGASKDRFELSTAHKYTYVCFVIDVSNRSHCMFLPPKKGLFGTMWCWDLCPKYRESYLVGLSEMKLDTLTMLEVIYQNETNSGGIKLMKFIEISISLCWVIEISKIHLLEMLVISHCE